MKCKEQLQILWPLGKMIWIALLKKKQKEENLKFTYEYLGL